MEDRQTPKRPRLNIWGDSSTHQASHPNQQQQIHATYPPHSQYPPTPTLGGWETIPAVSEPNQHDISNSRSQSLEISALTPPQSVQYIPSQRSDPANGLPLTQDLPTSAEINTLPNYLQSAILHSLDMYQKTTSSSPRQRPKPLQTMQTGVYQNTQGFYSAAVPLQPGPGTADHSHVQISAGVEIGSPSSTMGANVQMLASAGYSGMQPAPGNGGGGVLLDGAQDPKPVGTTYPPRRKAIRAIQACDVCRARKSKCDEGRPSCGFCKESQTPCIYREVPPSKQDRTLMQIFERLGKMENLLDKIHKRDRSPQDAGNSLEPVIRQTQQLHDAISRNSPSIAPPIYPKNLAETPLDEDEQLTIPNQQTAAVHKLLQWPSIRKQIDERLLKQETYLIDEEEKRGVLRIYGRSESANSQDALFGEDFDPTDEWGDILFRDAPGSWDRQIGENTDQSLPETSFGPSGPDHLTLDRPTVIELLNSYLANIHILHPILDTATITRSVLCFVGRFAPSPSFPHLAPPGKRKRSPPAPEFRPRSIPRTIPSALVLLVLSLGAVCLHRKPVPGPLPGQGQHQGPSDVAHARKRNVDVIPGLAYFAKAIDIMGALAGSNGLENVQAMLLAGLYYGQLARVLDSWKWISWACMGCQILIRMKLHQENDELKKDLILRAFWSCLQLESDVLAELDLPPSGISRLEDSMLLPSGISSSNTSLETKEDDPLMWMYYLAQIALRKLLNRAHTALNKQDKTHLDSPRSLAIAHKLDYQLEQWKTHLPEPLRWEFADPPSPDINAARLRAKYFVARDIIYRPFVYHALHADSSSISSRRVPPVDDGTELEESCRKGIEAALKSMTAFHAFDPEESRPIITNVFGTAHAQFGNLLVLQAAHHSPVLRGLIDARVLGKLFEKTIHWLRTLDPISPPLRKDAAILEDAAAKLKLGGGLGLEF